MSEIDKDGKQDADRNGKIAQPNPARRAVLKASALALATAGTYGAAPFFGPWKHNHVWSQTAQKKPLVTRPHDGCQRPVRRSGMDERARRDDGDRGIQRQGRRDGPQDRVRSTVDTETTPATGSRVAERMIIAQDVQLPDRRASTPASPTRSRRSRRSTACIYLNTNSQLAERSRARTATASSSSGTATAPTSRWRRQERDGSRSARTGCC